MRMVQNIHSDTIITLFSLPPSLPLCSISQPVCYSVQFNPILTTSVSSLTHFRPSTVFKILRIPLPNIFLMSSQLNHLSFIWMAPLSTKLLTKQQRNTPFNSHTLLFTFLQLTFFQSPENVSLTYGKNNGISLPHNVLFINRLELPSALSPLPPKYSPATLLPFSVFSPSFTNYPTHT